jgi:hypothetical protein
MAFVVQAGDSKYKNSVGKELHWTVVYYPAADTQEKRDQVMAIIKKCCIDTLGTNIVRLTPHVTSKEWKNSVFFDGDAQRVMNAVYTAMEAAGMPVDPKTRRNAHVELRGKTGGIPDPELHLDRLWPSVDIGTVYFME